MPKKPLVAIVDDDASVRAALQSLLRSLGLAEAGFASAEEFLGSRRIRSTACVIADVNMPGTTGPELHRRLVGAGIAIPIILITAYPDEGVREQALRAGVVGYLSKPFHDDDLLACLRSALADAIPGGRDA